MQPVSAAGPAPVPWRPAPPAFPPPRGSVLPSGLPRPLPVTAGPPARRLTAVERVQAVLRVQTLALQLLPHPLAQEPVPPHRIQRLLLPAAGGHGCAASRSLATPHVVPHEAADWPAWRSAPLLGPFPFLFPIGRRVKALGADWWRRRHAAGSNGRCGGGGGMGDAELRCTVAVEQPLPGGEAPRRRVMRGALVLLGRNELRQPVLRVVGGSGGAAAALSFVLAGDAVRLFTRFAGDGRAAVRVGPGGAQVLLSDCPPDALRRFLRLLRLKIAAGPRGAPRGSRLLDRPPAAFAVISPLQERDLLRNPGRPRDGEARGERPAEVSPGARGAAPVTGPALTARRRPSRRCPARRGGPRRGSRRSRRRCWAPCGVGRASSSPAVQVRGRVAGAG